MKLFRIFLLVICTVYLQAQSNSAVEASADIVFYSFDSVNDTLINAGILVSLEKDWHIYWRNSGDSGIPTSFEIELPENFSLTELKWPVPKIFEFEGYASYGYENKVLFPFQIILPTERILNSFPIKVKLKSLICKDVCKPFNTEVSKVFDLNSNYQSSTEIKELFENTLNHIPEKNFFIDIDAKEIADKVLMNITSQRLNLKKIKTLHFIPYENGIFRNSLTQNFKWNNESIQLEIEYDQFKTKTPELIGGILLLEISSEEGVKKVGYEISVKLN
ncbi:Putative cytochrome c biogenesis protein [Ignavibacterium album JCM 16511]|uniref:Putative cytochrome c biogenesis protein n=1 Tax=Ignavibacterium album (strain DSM 19864 / JCM 16511 / NBRC 101810 / Mat9-16) TaxID=945713 RepID=I0AGW9_IGNAJ|nr:protein-disulfide reductase DsbD domain-containing protein [Ignavibacterium album]AFH48226.1 Putative cytochrome c biogenesis protein [Ignavibacterium album JCM 16511]